ncbi:alpha-hydroxy acid oxidase [Candidatus Leptofilum sp.]|uniref:alpha-hydroxy acid oxidase n=1 Tax=Candidatus Leptofilum sp. TaxID=3241576 RepID=UPI003B5C96AE
MSLLNIYDYEQAAAEKMAAPYYAYFAGGVADNLTLHENRAAFDRIKLLPRIFRDVSQISLETVIGGEKRPSPFLIAPAAMHKLGHPDGELATARAAAAFGMPQILSTLSSVSVDEVTAVGHPVWFQLYIFRDRAWSKEIVQRSEAAGCTALVVTVDVPVQGLRENLKRINFSIPADLPLPNLARPGVSRDNSTLLHLVEENFDPGLTWGDITWLRSFTKLPIWVKGILRADDAQRAADAGVAGVIVSNHGGRQLDTAVTPIEALPAIAQAVGHQTELILDGGIRRGTDALKALALGANGVALGRAPLWGLAVGGEAGVQHILQILHDELRNVMAQCGCTTIAELTPDLIYTPPQL